MLYRIPLFWRWYPCPQLNLCPSMRIALVNLWRWNLHAFFGRKGSESTANLKKDLAACSVNQFPGSVLPSLQLSRVLSTPKPEPGEENKLAASWFPSSAGLGFSSGMTRTHSLLFCLLSIFQNFVAVLLSFIFSVLWAYVILINVCSLPTIFKQKPTAFI